MFAHYRQAECEKGILECIYVCRLETRNVTPPIIYACADKANNCAVNNTQKKHCIFLM